MHYLLQSDAFTVRRWVCSSIDASFITVQNEEGVTEEDKESGKTRVAARAYSASSSSYSYGGATYSKPTAHESYGDV